MPTGTYEPPERGHQVDQGLKSKIANALAGQAQNPYASYNIVSAMYAGRDDRGRPIYRVVYNTTLTHPGSAGSRRTPNVTKTFTLVNGQIDSPSLSGKGTPSTGGSSGGSGGGTGGGEESTADPAAERLRQAKDAAMKRIQSLNIPADYQAAIISSIQSYKGTVFGLNNMVEIRLSTIPKTDDLPTGFPGDDGLGSGSFGSGSGFSGPEYVKPDRRVVEDMVKGSLISLTGEIDEGLLEEGVDVYMRDHRRNFDNPEEEIDPTMSALEFIRNTEKYQKIHELRPESVDERTWISQRRGAAAEGGLTVGAQEDFAIEQAAAGGDVADVADAAAMEQFQRSGSARGTLLEDKMRSAAQSMFRGVVR